MRLSQVLWPRWVRPQHARLREAAHCPSLPGPASCSIASRWKEKGKQINNAAKPSACAIREAGQREPGPSPRGEGSLCPVGLCLSLPLGPRPACSLVREAGQLLSGLPLPVLGAPWFWGRREGTPSLPRKQVDDTGGWAFKCVDPERWPSSASVPTRTPPRMLAEPQEG